MKQTIIGVDLAKDGIQVCIYTRSTRRCRFQNLKIIRNSGYQ